MHAQRSTTTVDPSESRVMEPQAVSASAIVAPGGGRTVRLGRRRYPVELPSRGDPRLRLSLITFSLFVIGIGWLDFRLSIPQILAALFTAALIDSSTTLWRRSVIAWPASALQSASSIALLLRAAGTESNDLWSFHGWYYFAGAAALSLVLKHFIRYDGRHLFNPSNIALVLAFVVLGSDRVEPLDLWWGPLDLPLVLAYSVIIFGGVSLGRRLNLLPMGLTFWAVLAVGMGALAAIDHSITAQWALGPIAGTHFWWIVMTSPEVLIYVFFMLTDPRTIPSGRSARLVFAALVGAVASVLVAPWETEFGAKVGLLAGLTVVSAFRPWLERALPESGSALDEPRSLAWSMVSHDDAGGRRLAPLRVAACVTAIAVFVGVVAGLGSPADGNDRPGPVALLTVPPVDPETLPTVVIDDNVHKLDKGLASSDGAAELAAALAWNLAVEHEAIRTRDPGLLAVVDHGYRLEQQAQVINELRTGEPAVAHDYEFDSLRLIIAYPGGAQAGANAGLVAVGTAIEVEYSNAGVEMSRSERPFETTFTLRRMTSGDWQITDTIAVPRR